MWLIPPHVQVFQDFIPVGARNRPGHHMRPEGITVHDTGNTQQNANAKAHAKYIKSPDAAARPASWHFTVDDREIWQHLPLTENGWHAGDGRNGPGNRTTIGIEMCVNRGGDLNRTEANSIWLISKLILNSGSISDIISASVYQHWHWNKSNCPRQLRDRPSGWSEFIDAIKRQLHRLPAECDMINKSLAERIANIEISQNSLKRKIGEITETLDLAAIAILNRGEQTSPEQHAFD